MNLPCLTFYDILREATCLKLVFTHSLFSEKHLSYILCARQNANHQMESHSLSHKCAALYLQMNVECLDSNSLVTKQGIANCKCQSLNNHRGIIRVICPHYPSSGFHPVFPAPGWPRVRPIFPLTPDSEVSEVSSAHC